MAPKLEITQMPINRMDRQLWDIHTIKYYLAVSLFTYVYTHIYIYFYPKSIYMEN